MRVQVEIVVHGRALFMELAEENAYGAEWFVERLPFGPVFASRHGSWECDAVGNLLDVSAIVTVGNVHAEVVTCDVVC